MKQPTTRSELIPDFDLQGNWLEPVREVLEAYGVPAPRPCAERELCDAEARLGLRLPPDWRALLSELGALDLEAVAFLEPAAVCRADTVWFAAHLKPDERMRLSGMVCVAETAADNAFVWDPATGLVHLVSHDPAGIYEQIPCVGELVRWSLVGLAAGRYGWPGQTVVDLVANAQLDMFDAWALSQGSR